MLEVRGRRDNQEEDNENEFLTHQQILADGIRRVSGVPIALTRGFTKLAHKCASLCTKLYFYILSRSYMLKYRCSFGSYCTDLGTEVGAPLFGLGSADGITASRPSWMAKALEVQLAESEGRPIMVYLY